MTSSNRSKYRDEEGTLRFSVDGSEVFPGPTGVSCIDGPGTCAGPVEWRTTPDRTDGKHFPRCEHHFELRLKQSERNAELMSPSRPAWFDESYAGERWDEDV